MVKLISETLQNPKIAATISASTGTTGTLTMFDWIPGDIGKLASFVGLILSLIFGYFAIEKALYERKQRRMVGKETEKRLKQ